MLLRARQEAGRPRRIMFDVGGVIADGRYRHTDPDRWLDGTDYLNTRLTPRIIEGIGALTTEDFSSENSFVVSRCGPGTQVRTRQFFTHINFYERTGIFPDHVFFCEQREGKAEIANVIKITDAVDDRLENLGRLIDRVPTIQKLCLFMPDDKEVARYAQYREFVQAVDSSDEMVAHFRSIATNLGEPTQ